MECDGFFLSGNLRPGRGSRHSEYLLRQKTFPYVVKGWMDERIVKVRRSTIWYGGRRGKSFWSPDISIEYDFIAKLPTSAKASFILHVEDQ
jgi:hypothetical protein